jgi:polysaccharide pyruvyl transferase WcaK-like protein
MRILIEPGCFDCLNMGDVAMLQVTVDRLRELWPEARIQVSSDAPESLHVHCPTAEPVDALGRHIWFENGYLCSPLHRLLPEPLTLPLLEMERRARRRYHFEVETLLRLKKSLLRQDCTRLRPFLRAVNGADLIVVSGQGSINDIFHDHALNVLDVLGMAIRRGAFTALFGQGIGPLGNPRLRARVKEILPNVNVLALREGRAALPLLDSLDIDRSAVEVTGDDAIELAYNQRRNELGNAIGVNLRVSSYSSIDDTWLGKVGSVLRRVAKKLGVPMLSVPIAINNEVSDLKAVRRLLDGYEQSDEWETGVYTPLQVINRIGECRIVVAGSYHAAVFAMAQGIPTVCLANSEYYINKFMGLAEQFGTGCKVVMNDKQLSDTLEPSIEDAWRLAEDTRSSLLEAAVRQIEASRAAYYKLYQHVSSGGERNTGIAHRRLMTYH